MTVKEAALAAREQELITDATELADRTAGLAAREREFNATANSRNAELFASETALAQRQADLQSTTEKLRELLG
jgi:hypothetical protein